jgi:hypothetical protein
MKNKKTIFTGKTIRHLNTQEVYYKNKIDLLLKGDSQNAIITILPSFASIDGKIRPLILNKTIVTKVENDHGKILLENLVINANDFDYVIKNMYGDPDKINLLKRIPDSNNILVIGANRNNGFFTVTHYEVDTKNPDKLKNLLKKGDSLDRNGRAAVPSFATLL